MTSTRRLTTVVLCLLPFGTVHPARAETCRLRLLQAMPGAEAVAAWLDGVAWSERLPYASFTPWRDVEAGERNIKVTAVGGPRVLDDRDAILSAGRSYTVALLTATTPGAGRLLLLEDRPGQIEPDRAIVRFVHLATAGDAAVGVAGLAPVATLASGQLSQPVPFDPVEVLGEFQVGPERWRSTPTKLTVRTQWTFYLVGDATRGAAQPPRVLVDAVEGR